MNKLIVILTTLVLSFIAVSCSGQSDEKVVVLETTQGEIRVKLYNETPRFRDNFIKNVKDGMYDGVYFHRIIRGFMIQTGDPDTRPGKVQDSTKVSPMIPQEIVFPTHFHKKGVLAAAKEEDDQNPNDEADAFQFYIVTGRTFQEVQLDEYEQGIMSIKAERLYKKKLQQHEKDIDSLRATRDKHALSNYLEKLHDQAEEETPRFEYTTEQKRAYRTVGGAPWLDSEYTVFGEVVEGMKTVLTIEKTKTNDEGFPFSEVRILKAYVAE